MRYSLNEKTVAILEILDVAANPMGSWALVERLEERGIFVSSATVGRLLSSLEHAGLVEKINNNGRAITPAGKDALQTFYLSDHMNDQKLILESMVLEQNLTTFVSVLQARRAIESETAWLAARHITDAEIEALQAILDSVALHGDDPEFIAKADVQFHMGIAHASGNKILDTLYAMLFPYGQQTTTFAKIRKKFNYSTTHQDILNALRAHDAKLAEQRMIQHIDSMISGLTAYWGHFSQNK